MATTTKGTAGKQQSSESISENWDQLSDQVERLGADLSAINDSLANLARAGVTEGRERARAQLDDLARRSRELTDEVNARGRRMAHDAGEQAGAMSRELEAAINRNPMTSILIALGLGFVIGLSSRGRR